MLTLLVAAALAAADLPAGQIIDTVQCANDESQSYALYLPSAYTPERLWPVIFAFDPGARGRNGVDRYQAAAEQYGYIVAGSNNSRNGEDYTPAVAAMTRDVLTRFKIDPKRIYTAGMSGGARVALSVALASKRVAGVLASSAGYPDGIRRTKLDFPVFATAGTEDFNHLEMRMLDADLTTPHHLEIFEGGHVWLSSALALDGIEWMEIQAMKSGIKARDVKEIDSIFTKRTARITERKDKDNYLAVQSLVDDFKGLRDISLLEARAKALSQDRGVQDGLQRDFDEDNRETVMMNEVAYAERRLEIPSEVPSALAELRQRWQKLSDDARKPTDSSERRLARRVLSSLGASIRTDDPEYLKIIQEYRLPRGGLPK